MENKWQSVLNDLEILQAQEERIREQEELAEARRLFAEKYANRAERRRMAREARRAK